jgi:hypothetical protein
LEIERLITFLDACDPYVVNELEGDDDREEVGDREPSLGSFDRMINQEKSYRQAFCAAGDTDAEQDDCDREDDDPDEAKDQPLEMGARHEQSKARAAGRKPQATPPGTNDFGAVG